MDYFLGLDTTFATSTFLSSDLEPFPLLAGQSENLILPARVLSGREIVISRDCTMDIRFGWNPCSCSTTNGSMRPAMVVELLGAFGPPPTGGQTLSTFEVPSGSAPPELGNVLIQYSAEVAATFPTIGPLARLSESRIQCVRMLPGDHRATEGDPVAVFSVLSVNIALTQVQPLPGVEVLTATGATYQLEFAEDTGVSPVRRATGAAAEGNGEIQVLSDSSGETGSKPYRVVVSTE